MSVWFRKLFPFAKGQIAEKRNSKAKIHSITITDSKFEP